MMKTDLRVVPAEGCAPPDVEANGPAGEAPAAPSTVAPESTAALEGMSTQELRDAMTRVVQGAQAVWGDFEKRMVVGHEKPSARDVASALLASDSLLRAEMTNVWAHIGVAVQESRIAVKAVGDLGRGLLTMLKELEKRQHEMADTLATLHVMPEQACHWTQIDTASLESALGMTEHAPEPEALPDGSTRTDPVAPTTDK